MTRSSSGDAVTALVVPCSAAGRHGRSGLGAPRRRHPVAFGRRATVAPQLATPSHLPFGSFVSLPILPATLALEPGGSQLMLYVEPLPHTRSSKGSKFLYVGYMEPLWGRKTLSREGASADERASQEGEAQEYPTVGAGALLQQRSYVGDTRLL